MQCFPGSTTLARAMSEGLLLAVQTGSVRDVARALKEAPSQINSVVEVGHPLPRITSSGAPPFNVPLATKVKIAAATSCHQALIHPSLLPPACLHTLRGSVRRVRAG
jgi:hypothetical protein